MTTKNISDCTIEELKIVGFDHIHLIGKLQQELQAIQQEVARRQAQPTSEQAQTPSENEQPAT